MSITPEVPAKTFTELVARQIRIAMAVENIRQSELARRMKKTEQWVSVRLRGRQPIDVNDMLLFARALEVGVHQLMPSPEEAEEARSTQGYSHVAVRPPATGSRPRDNRPNGRAASGPARTAYVDRPGHPKRGR